MLMSDNPGYLDSILEDIENVVGSDEKNNSLKFIPRPPNEQPQKNNPKAKFVTGSNAQKENMSQYSDNHFTLNRSNNVQENNGKYVNSNITNCTNKSSDGMDDTSIDELLEMLKSPRREKAKTIISPPPVNSEIKTTPTSHRNTISNISFSGSTNSGSKLPNSDSKAKSKNIEDDPDLFGLLEDSSFDNNDTPASYRGTPSSCKSTLDNQGSFNDRVSSAIIGKSSSSNSNSTNSSKLRCTKVVLAGFQDSAPRGRRASAFSKVACDHLRCLQCNFEVLQFSNYEWNESVDYMFFRNNVPNVDKLSQKLDRLDSSCAYCCQCSWVSTKEEMVLTSGNSTQPQWICGGH